MAYCSLFFFVFNILLYFLFLCYPHQCDFMLLYYSSRFSLLLLVLLVLFCPPSCDAWGWKKKEQHVPEYDDDPYLRQMELERRPVKQPKLTRAEQKELQKQMMRERPLWETHENYLASRVAAWKEVRKTRKFKKGGSADFAVRGPDGKYFTDNNPLLMGDFEFKSKVGKVNVTAELLGQPMRCPSEEYMYDSTTKKITIPGLRDTENCMGKYFTAAGVDPILQYKPEVNEIDADNGIWDPAHFDAFE